MAAERARRRCWGCAIFDFGANLTGPRQAPTSKSCQRRLCRPPQSRPLNIWGSLFIRRSSVQLAPLHSSFHIFRRHQWSSLFTVPWISRAGSNPAKQWSLSGLLVSQPFTVSAIPEIRSAIELAGAGDSRPSRFFWLRRSVTSRGPRLIHILGTRLRARRSVLWVACDSY